MSLIRFGQGLVAHLPKLEKELDPLLNMNGPIIWLQ